MATAYDTWLDRSAADEAADEADERREEWIAERTAELTAARIREDEPVQEAIESVLSGDYDSVFSAALRRFFLAYEAAQTNAGMAEAAKALADSLRPSVESHIRATAETAAAAEFDRREQQLADDAAEARASAREAA